LQHQHSKNQDAPFSAHCYLDWNATTPPHPEVLEAMRAVAAAAWANPASVHGPGRRAREQVEEAREAIARLVRFHPRDVLLTSGGTEANNIALRSATATGGGSIVVSRIEHPSITRTAEDLERTGVAVLWAEPDASGVVTEQAIEDALGRAAGRGDVRLVALQAVNHETGVIQPVAGVGLLARRFGASLHVDAVQAVGRLDPSAWEGADSVAVAAHKIRGPKGIGALVTRPGLRLAPLLLGGAQERGLRPGTQDPVACAGFAVAARRAMTSVIAYRALEALRDRLEAELVAMTARLGMVPPRRNGEAPRAPHVSNLSWSGWRGEELCAALDLEGVAVSSGSACSAGTADPSPVLQAMLGDERARSAVRISLGEETTLEQVRTAIACFERVLGRTSRVS
jgi:cysteine desulfurase